MDSSFRFPLKMPLVASSNSQFDYCIEYLCKSVQKPNPSQLSAMEDFCAAYRQTSASAFAFAQINEEEKLAADAKAEDEADAEWYTEWYEKVAHEDAERRRKEEEKEEYRRYRAEERAARGRGITMSEMEAVVGYADMNIEDVLKEIHKNRSQEQAQGAQEQHEAARVWAASAATDAERVLCTWDFNIPHAVSASPANETDAQKKKEQAAFLRKVQPWWPFMRVKNMLKCFHNPDIPKRVSYMQGLELMAKAASIDVESLVGMPLSKYIKLAGVSQYDLIARGLPFHAE